MSRIICEGVDGSMRALPSPQHSASAVMLASMTGGACRIRRPSLDKDLIVLLEGLRAMGLEATLHDGDLITEAAEMGVTADRVDVKGSESAFCLLSALSTSLPRRIIVDGAIPSRFPMRSWVNALLNLGAKLEFPRDDWKLPLTIRGPPTNHMTYLPGDSPNLLFLSILLSTLNGVLPARIEAVGPKPDQLLHPCDAELISQFGVRVESTSRVLKNPGNQSCRPADVAVPSDERVSDFLACLGLAHGRLRISDVSMAPPLQLRMAEAGLDICYEDGVMEAMRTEPGEISLDLRGCLYSVPMAMVTASSWPEGARLQIGARGSSGREGESLQGCMSMLQSMGCDARLEGEEVLVPGAELGEYSAKLRGDEDDLAILLAATLSSKVELDGLFRIDESYPGLLSGLSALGLELPSWEEPRVPLF